MTKKWYLIETYNKMLGDKYSKKFDLIFCVMMRNNIKRSCTQYFDLIGFNFWDNIII